MDPSEARLPSPTGGFARNWDMLDARVRLCILHRPGESPKDQPRHRVDEKVVRSDGDISSAFALHTGRHLHRKVDGPWPDDLRHAFASLMLSQGTRVDLVSRMLGHAKPATTLNIYAHMLPGDQEEALRRLELALGG